MARTLTGLLVLFLGACASGPNPSAASSPTPEATPAPTEPSPQPSGQECVDASITGDVQARVVQEDNVFSPSCLTVLGGQGLAILNRGANLHNFSIQGTQVDIDTPPGEATRTEAIGGAVEPGTYTFFCKYFRAEGMAGQLTITPAG